MPQKKSKTGLIIAIVLGVFGVCCVLPILGGGFFGFNLFKKLTPMIGCVIGMDEAQQAIRLYADEHSGKLPNAKTWQDDLRPYYSRVEKDGKDKPPFKTFPVDGEWVCNDDKDQRTGIAFNSELSGKKLADIKDPYSTVLLFEVDQPGMNQSATYKYRPKNTGPKLFGEHRDWLYINVSGALHQKSGNFNFDSGDDSSDSKSKSGAKGKSSDSSGNN